MAKKQHFDPVDPKVNFPALEEKILSFWKENKIFEKSVESRPEDKKWTFLDGPPFITGLPHYGSLLSSIPKDLYPRFWTMKGYRVRRVWGWDCHGLPAENKVENKLGIKRKRDIEEVVGVKKFIDECKLYVKDVSGEWEWYIDHIARWVDFKNAYKTMDKSYMESVMWVFKQMYDKGNIYKGLRVSLYCPHCSTPISNFEVAMDPDNYSEEDDKATTYKYKLVDDENTYLLAWSTTPWNKIVTPALAVNPKINYVEVEQENEKGEKEKYILAEDTQGILLQSRPHKLLRKFKGKELLDKNFELHYDFYKEGEKVGRIIAGDFVSSEEGTGIVTIAAYGEDDLKVMQENDIQIYLHVDEEGMIKNEVPIFGGKYYFDVNEEVDRDLDKRGLIYHIDAHRHSVAHCWRCHTRLFYAPQDAWYVNIQDLKSKLKKNNKDINWFPPHFKMGRFLKSIEAAPDWCISRSRYWGSPVPVWECECGERFVPGSIAELEEASGQKIDELHKPEIDEVVVKCKKCGKDAHRVPEVLDSWIEAGSAPFAERHFPFDKTLKLDDFFPPDFIVEYTGQIRAWFYVLHVIGTALYDSHAFKNVIVTGVILGTDGRKMSKNFGNYPDPKKMIEQYGGDALRLYLMGSPVMRGEDILISEDEYRQQVRGTMLILWNTYNYFVSYANKDGWELGKTNESSNILDTWVMTLLNTLVKEVTDDLEGYDTPSAVKRVAAFITEFSTWYIRRSRARDDKQEFYATCHTALKTLCQVMAPIAPFITEEIYKNLTKDESVHLSDWPKADKKYLDKELLEKMTLLRTIVELGHAQRQQNQIKVRQPLQSITISNFPFELGELEAILLDELNVKSAKTVGGSGALSVELDTNLTDELKAEGEAREIVRQIQDERKTLGTALDEKINVYLPSWPEAFEEYIKSKALISNLSKGEFKVERIDE